MTITVDLPHATALKLQEQAAASGKDIASLVREAVEFKVAGPTMTLREILEPIHRQVAESGTSDAELDDFAERVVAATRPSRAIA